MKKQVEAFHQYLRREEKSAATVEKYLRDVRVFCDFVGKRAVTKDVVLDYSSTCGRRATLCAPSTPCSPP